MYVIRLGPDRPDCRARAAMPLLMLLLLSGCGNDDSVHGTYAFDMAASRAMFEMEGHRVSDTWFYCGGDDIVPPKSITLRADGSADVLSHDGRRKRYVRGSWHAEGAEIFLNGKRWALYSPGRLQLRMMLDATSNSVEPDDKSYGRNTPLIYEK